MFLLHINRFIFFFNWIVANQHNRRCCFRNLWAKSILPSVTSPYKDWTLYQHDVHIWFVFHCTFNQCKYLTRFLENTFDNQNNINCNFTSFALKLLPCMPCLWNARTLSCKQTEEEKKKLCTHQTNLSHSDYKNQWNCTSKI